MLVGGLHAPRSTSRCSPRADTVVICVPTPLDEDRRPDLSAVAAPPRRSPRNLQRRHAGRPGVHDLSRHHRRGRPPDPRGGSGLRRGRRLPPRLLARSASTRATPSTACATPRRSSAGYTAGLHRRAPRRSTASSSTRSCRSSGTREAEMAKLLENTYRHVNIALVNEMAMFCHELGIDLWDVDRGRAPPSRSASRRSTRAPASGGHCIPIDPNYLSLHGAQARLPVPLRRAGAGDQRADAGVRRGPRAAPAQPARKPVERRAGCCCSA